MIKIVSFFLIGIIILAMTGRLRLLKFERIVPSTKKCIDCGRLLANLEKCGCNKKTEVITILFMKKFFNGRHFFYCWNSNSFN